MELNISNDRAQWYEQLIEEKYAKWMTKAMNERIWISNWIPKKCDKKIKNGMLKELENDQEVVLQHVKKWNWIYQTIEHSDMNNS